MRISIATKLLLSFFFILALSFLPAYWYLRRDLRTRVMDGVENELGRHAQLVAARLWAVPDSQIDAVAREISTILVDRVSIVSVDGRIIGESAVPAGAMAQLENHLDREEVQEALQKGQGSAVRPSPTKGEPYLYVARLLRGPDGKPRAVVRMSRPLGVITKSFQGAVTFLYRAAGVAASLVLVMSLGATLYTVRPLLRIRQAALAYARGEYTYPLPAPSRDEIGDLGESMAELARRIQKERAAHSADFALRGELLRALPVPVLLLDADCGVQELNAPFREAVDIDPAHEDARVHEITHAPEFTRAAETAAQSMQPQPLSVPVPWRRAPLRLRLCPLPAPGGRVAWALVGDSEPEGSAAGRKALRRSENLVEELALTAEQPLASRLHELRVYLGLLHPAPVPAPGSVVAVDLGALLGRLLKEFEEAAAAQGARLEVPDALPRATVADSDGRLERVLRAALFRTLTADRRRAPTSEDSHPPRPPRGGLRHGEIVLELMVHRDKTVVLLQVVGMGQAVSCADLDQLLSPLGGGVGPTREAAAGAPGSGPIAGSELWIQLRLA